MPETLTTLTGQILYDAGTGAFQAATVYIYLEDVSRADAAALPLASRVLPDISHTEGETSGPAFTLQVQPPDPNALVAVRVHVDLDGDGRYSRGDFITMESYPVLTRGCPNHVTVRVRKI